MKEYKFRAIPRNLANEQFPNLHPKRKMDFVYGSGLYDDGVNIWLILIYDNKKCFADLKGVIVENESIKQYTGFKDIQNKEIYEDDIVSLSGCKYDIARVVWFDGRYELRINNNEVAWGLNSNTIREHHIKILDSI